MAPTIVNLSNPGRSNQINSSCLLAQIVAFMNNTGNQRFSLNQSLPSQGGGQRKRVFWKSRNPHAMSLKLYKDFTVPDFIKNKVLSSDGHFLKL